MVGLVINVIMFLSKQNLSFRCRVWILIQETRKVFLKLIAQYNPVITEHLSGTQLPKKRMTMFLSPTICYTSQSKLLEESLFTAIFTD